jgi:hypothetical protein
VGAAEPQQRDVALSEPETPAGPREILLPRAVAEVTADCSLAVSDLTSNTVTADSTVVSITVEHSP